MLLHGGMGNAIIGATRSRRSSKRYRAIVIDSRGHGRSTMPDDQP